MLIELSSQRREGLRESMEQILAAGLEKGLVLDATICESVEQAKAFWRIRELFGEMQGREGGSIKHDVSVPVANIPAFIEEGNAAARKLIPGCRPMPFGHVGDGNIHYNITQPVGADKAEYLKRWDDMNDAIYKIVLKYGGSVSAEHGVGIVKRDYLPKIKDPVAYELMKTLKRTLDPKGILNPGKVLVARSPLSHLAPGIGRLLIGNPAERVLVGLFFLARFLLLVRRSAAAARAGACLPRACAGIASDTSAAMQPVRFSSASPSIGRAIAPRYAEAPQSRRNRGWPCNRPISIGPSEQRALPGVHGLPRLLRGLRLLRRRLGRVGAVGLVQRRRVVRHAVDRRRNLIDLHRALGRRRKQLGCHVFIDVFAIEPEIELLRRHDHRRAVVHRGHCRVGLAW